MRRLGGDRAGEIRFTRFLRNPSVSLAEMIGLAFARTQAACAGRDILAIQDTTVTRSSGGGGDYLHAMIAVDAGSGAILGALDAQFLERTEGGKASRKRRAPQDRQSASWRACADTAGQIEGAARVTVLADREADIFDLFAHRPAHVDLLVRATHDRALEEGGRLATRMAETPRMADAFDASRSPPCSKRPTAASKARPLGRRPPTPKAPLPSPAGSVPGSADGRDIMESRDPS